jgi:NIMA (never in mitosis gene a)-related kinase 1/4/5
MQVLRPARARAVCQSVPYSSKADTWSLGCVLYELCTLSQAFASDSLYSLIFRIINGTYDPINTQRYTSHLARLVSSLLNKEPARRPSCSALLADAYVREHIEKTMMKVWRAAPIRMQGRSM